MSCWCSIQRQLKIISSTNAHSIAVRRAASCETVRRRLPFPCNAAADHGESVRCDSSRAGGRQPRFTCYHEKSFLPSRGLPENMMIPPLIALAAWVPISLFCFRRYAVRIAILVNFVGGWAVLPSAAFTDQ